MTIVRFKNLNVGRSRPSNKFQTHSIGNENFGYNKVDTWLFPISLHLWIRGG
jgi:hypothetical protein